MNDQPERNRRILIDFALVQVAYHAVSGLHVRQVLIVASALWVMGFVAIQLRWKADPEGGRLAIRKELVRQGRMCKHAWAWAGIPSLLGLGLSAPWTWVVFAPFGVWFSIRAWQTGEDLIRQGNA